MSNYATGGGFDISFGRYNNNSAYSKPRVTNRNNYSAPARREEYVKRSGCTSGIGKNDQPYVRGWKYTKSQGLVTFFAAPYKGTKKHIGAKRGNTHYNWVVKIETQRNFQTVILPCIANAEMNKVSIPKIGYVMNPKGGYGGYVGTYIMRKRGR